MFKVKSSAETLRILELQTVFKENKSCIPLPFFLTSEYEYLCWIKPKNSPIQCLSEWPKLVT